jgi:hypothetical protein
MSHHCTIFLHIPKTAGVTLGNVLKLKYRPSSILRLESLEKPLQEIEKVPLDKRRHARVVLGHLHHGVHRYMPQECAYVTILREPVSRVLSMYRYIRGDPYHWLHERMLASGMTLEEFIDCCADPGIDNHQTRLISGEGSGSFVPGKEPPKLTANALANAKRNLEDFLVVGLNERFDESFILIRRAMGWRLPLYVSSNVSKRANEGATSPKVIERILERNQLDLELYDFARELFQSEVRAQGSSLAREVAVFKVLNRIPEKIGPPAEGLIRRLLPSRFPGRRA